MRIGSHQTSTHPGALRTVINRRAIALSLCLGFALFFARGLAHAQYKLTNLVSNQVGAAKNDDPLIANGWGIAHGPGPLWVSDEASGWSTLYDPTGVQKKPIVFIPSANGAGPGQPTGIVFNSTTDFQVQGGHANFIFSTQDGTISAWAPTLNANVAFLTVNNSAEGASYTSLAVSNSPSENHLYAADIAHARVDMFDGAYSYVGSFTDPDLPSGYTPFGVQNIGGVLYVSFVPLDGTATGFVDTFKEDGSFVRRLIEGGPLAQPWGFAVAPANFGPLSNTLLISNNTNAGTINAFNIQTGRYVGTIRGRHGEPIHIDQLWGIVFGGGTPNNGLTNQLFFAAGPKNNLAGTLGVIEYAPMAEPEAEP